MGVSSNIIAELGIKHGMHVYVLSQGRNTAQFKHNRKGQTGLFVLHCRWWPRLVLSVRKRSQEHQPFDHEGRLDDKGHRPRIPKYAR